MKKILNICFILLLSIKSMAEITFPADNSVAGWKKSARMLRFDKNSLFDHINGAAELFIEFGFKKLLVQNYKNEEHEIGLELYQMESPEAALGIYLMKCGQENPVQEITARNSGNKYQFTIVKGSCFIQINNFSGNEKLQPTMVALTKCILTSISGNEPINIFDQLPGKNLIPGSELIIRGPFALQPIFTFGEGDVFQLCGKVFGIVGDYKDDNGNEYTLLLILYPDEITALSAYKNLTMNLDPYLKVLDKWDQGFNFKDYRNKFGIVEIKNHTVEIKVNLAERP